MFDPYYKWLGISPKEQPPNHYRLLAVDLFESDPEVIDAGANRQMAYLQQRATGEHAVLSQRLLNEIAAARLCLLNPQKKHAYDDGLKAKSGTSNNGPNSVSVAPHAPVQSPKLDEPASLPIARPKQTSGRPSTPFLGTTWRWKVMAASGVLVVLVVVSVFLWRAGQSREPPTQAPPEVIATVPQQTKIPEVQATVANEMKVAAVTPEPPSGSLTEGKVTTTTEVPSTGDQSNTVHDTPLATTTNASDRQPPSPNDAPHKYPEDAVFFGGRHYKVFWDQLTWEEAEQKCRRMGGHLACIENDEEKAFLADLKGKGKVVWLGAQRVEGDTWKWINGKPLDYRELKGHGHDPSYDYVGFHAGSGLNARPLNGHAGGMSVKDIQGYICEWE